MCSRDSTVRYIASWKTVAEETSIRAALKPHQEVIVILRMTLEPQKTDHQESEEQDHSCWQPQTSGGLQAARGVGWYLSLVWWSDILHLGTGTVGAAREGDDIHP